MALGLITQHAARKPVLWLFPLFSLAVLLAKVPVVGRQFTLEALIGWAGATLVLLALPRHSPATRLTLAGTALMSAYALAQFKPGQDPGTHALNWIPFQGQVGTLVGMSDILETLWPFMAIGLGLRWLTPWRWRRNVMLAGGLAIALLACTGVDAAVHPGPVCRLITDVLLAWLGWTLPWLLGDTRGRATSPEITPFPRQMRWAVPTLAVTVASLSFAGRCPPKRGKIIYAQAGRTSKVISGLIKYLRTKTKQTRETRETRETR